MSLLRAFIAVEIPPEIQNAIYRETADLRRALSPSLIRWVPQENLHLTLKFLGDISPSNVDILSQMLTAEAALFPCFSMQMSGLGSFPSPRRPRVIWIGIQAPAVLASLQYGIESASARLGYASEERHFSPHLTIGRVKQNVSGVEQQKVRQALEATHVGDLGTAQVEAVYLYKSDLKPTGSVYTRLYSAPLG